MLEKSKDFINSTGKKQQEILDSMNVLELLILKNDLGLTRIGEKSLVPYNEVEKRQVKVITKSFNKRIGK